MRFYSYIVIFVILIAFNSCGYKSSAKFARDIVGNKVSTTIKISMQNPENTVLIKDALDSSIKEVFHTSLVSRKNSITHLNLSIKKIEYRPIQYDINGYIIAYSAKIILDIEMIQKDFKKHFIVDGSYDFSVIANAVLSDQERFEAIRHSAIKAIKSFTSQISANGIKKGNL